MLEKIIKEGDIFSFFFLLFFSIALVISFFCFHVNIDFIFLKPYEYLISFFISVCILLLIIKVFLKKSFYYPSYTFYYLLFILLMFISSIFTEIENISLFIFLILFTFWGFIYWFYIHQLNLEKLKVKLLWIFYISALVNVIIGYMTGSMIGAFQEKNIFVTYISTGILISFFLYSSTKSKMFKIFLITGNVLLSSGMLISNFKVGSLELILGISILLVLNGFLKNKIKISKYVFISFFSGILIGLILTSNFEFGYSHQSSLTFPFHLENHISNIQRILLFLTSIYMFKNNLMFGVGLGDFFPEYLKYQQIVFEQFPVFKKYALDFSYHPHNEILRIVAEGGIIGVLGFSVAFLGFIKNFIFLLKNKDENILYISLLIPIVFHSIIGYPLDISIAHKIMFLTFLSFITYPLKMKKVLDFKAAFINIISFIFTLYFIYFSLKTLMDYKKFDYFMERLNKNLTIKEEILLPLEKNWYIGPVIKQYIYDLKLKKYLKKRYNLTRKELMDIINYIKISSYSWKMYPSNYLLKNRIKAFLLLGVNSKNIKFFDEAMKLAQLHEKLFPDDADNKKLKSIILLETLRTISQGERKK